MSLKRQIALVGTLAMGMAAAAPLAYAQQSATGPAHKMSIAATLVQLPNYSTFVSLLEEAHLMPTLRSAAKMTVFAPTNAAFAAVPQAQLDSLRANTTALRSMLLNHIVSGSIDTREVLKLQTARTLQGSRVRFGYENGKAEVNNQPIMEPAILATNGFIYGITGVVGMSGQK